VETGVTSIPPAEESRLANSDPSGRLKIAVMLHARAPPLHYNIPDLDLSLIDHQARETGFR
jgi:hypothetical protein